MGDSQREPRSQQAGALSFPGSWRSPEPRLDLRELRWPRIIGITGYKYSGKDSTGRELNVLGGYLRVAFADPLKEIASVLGWRGSKEEVPPCAHCGMIQGRELLQKLGTEAMRDRMWDSIWIDKLARTVLEDSEQRYVVTDVRFPNEADAVRSWEGVVWRVTRPGTLSDGHASEAGVDEIGPLPTIVNDGDFNKLRLSVMHMLSTY